MVGNETGPKSLLLDGDGGNLDGSDDLSGSGLLDFDGSWGGSGLLLYSGDRIDETLNLNLAFDSSLLGWL